VLLLFLWLLFLLVCLSAKMNKAISLLLFAAVLFGCVEGKYIRNTFDTDKKFNFLARFCFHTGLGSMSFQGNSTEASQLQIVCFYDGNGEWEEVWHSDCDEQSCCQENLKKAKEVVPFASGEVKPFKFSESIRAHYWYFALANCAGKSFSLDYTMTLLQPDPGMNQQFSCDETGVLLMYILFTILFTIGTVVHLYGDFQLFRARALHPIIRLLTISILLELFSLLFFMIANAIFASNGVGSPFLSVVAQVFDWLSTLIFMLLLILIAKGWGITFPTLSHFQEQKKILLGMLGLFLALYIVLFFWGLFGIDPASAIYLYSSVPGIIYLCVRFLTMLYFMWCLQQTVREDSDSTKRVFYMIFGLGYILWFLALPIIVLISLAVAVWVRAKIVTAIYLCTMTLGFAIIGFLLWPSRASRYFQVAVPDLLGSGYERL